MTLQFLINGISLGSVYALIAVGFALVFNILKFSNFAHGGLMSVTAYMGYIASVALRQYIDSIPLFIGTLIAAALGGGLLAIVVERLAFRRLRNNNTQVIYYFISSITMGILLENLITIFAGSNFYSYPQFFSSASLAFAGLTIAVPDLLMLIFSSSSLIILLGVLYKTKIGLAIRTMAYDVNTARLMGMDPNAVIAATFVASGILGGISGVFLGINYTLYPQLGQLVVKGFVASVIGGLGSITGAVIGAVLLGVVEVMLIGLVGAGWVPAFVFMIMLLFLLVRPRGIAGIIVQEKV
ncbi:branched-chain amino acid ABC transporter permease [Sporomusa sp.]|uniref:branched-chain amino acid ABC transporter permease n=1 Tax=Sporomusa sp. TaxID=2078658 RepID=UPI002CCF6654|nr:branched-chain amino acid ABC transporter permease [Sporomusa sp.]HWR41888.1 branched-chain amino acid ABC transporter permease [Sporomusa sp.]